MFFAIVFFGKFLMMDSKLRGLLLDVEEVAYVNPFCKNKKAKSSDKDSTINFSSDSKIPAIAIDEFCNAVFNFEVVQWHLKIAAPNYHPSNYTGLSLLEAHMQKFYPPPQV